MQARPALSEDGWAKLRNLVDTVVLTAAGVRPLWDWRIRELRIRPRGDA